MKKLTLITLLCVVFVVVSSTVSAQTSISEWLVTGDIGVTVQGNYTNNTLPATLHKTIPCTTYKHDVGNASYKEYCVVNAGNTKLSDAGELIITGSSKVNLLVNKLSTEDRLIPLASQDSIVALRGSGASTKVVLIKNPYNNLKLEKYGSAYKFSMVGTSQEVITDSLNNIPLNTDYYQTVSTNGKWFVGQNGKGIFKLNLITKELQYVRAGFYTTYDNNPNLKLAISNDGRHVAVYSARDSKFEIIDTQSCNNTQAKQGKDASCPYRDYFSTIKSSVADIYTAIPFKNLQFTNSSTISFFGYTNWVNTNQYMVRQIYINAPGTLGRQSTVDYLAMGDSFASGEGAYNYKDGTDWVNNKCHLSLLSYPYQIHNKGYTEKTESVACSGAKTKDIIQFSNLNYQEEDPQSSLYLDDDYKEYVASNFIVGSRRQIEFISNYKPNNVTISIGGNDIGFSGIIKNCVAGSVECYRTKQERQQLIHIIDNSYANLVRTYETIKRDGENNAKIYVIGYPLVAKPDGNCAANVKLSNTEIDFSIRITRYLNSVIKMAATQAGVAYVDTEHAFDGRRLCEADSSLVAVNGFTAGNDGPFPGWVERLVGNGPIGKESYHPNLIGHTMYARTIAMATNNFTMAMPTPSPGNPSQLTAEKRYVLENVPEGVEFGATSFYSDDMTTEGVVRGKNVDVSIPYTQFALKPNTTYTGTMYSTPTDLGTVTTDANGNINATVTIPQTIEPGYHTLHIRGPNILGETIDIQKIVFVAASEQDIDGDGITNEDEVCLIGEPAGVDVDKDGIDDACDGFIDVAPALPVTPEPTPDPSPEPVPTPTPGDKELIVSESMPEWLLQIEKEIAARQAIVNTPTPRQATIVTTPSQRQVPTISQPVATATTEQPFTVPQPPATQVAGVSSAVESFPLDQKSTINAWLFLPITIALFIVGTAWHRYIKARV